MVWLIVEVWRFVCARWSLGGLCCVSACVWVGFRLRFGCSLVNVSCGGLVHVCVAVGWVGCCPGDVAQMVERSLSMREVQGSIPCFSTDDVTVIKSVGNSTFPNVHFAVSPRNSLTLSNTFIFRLPPLDSFRLVLCRSACPLAFLCFVPFDFKACRLVFLSASACLPLLLHSICPIDLAVGFEHSRCLLSPSHLGFFLRTLAALFRRRTRFAIGHLLSAACSAAFGCLVLPSAKQTRQQHKTCAKGSYLVGSGDQDVAIPAILDSPNGRGSSRSCRMFR